LDSKARKEKEKEIQKISVENSRFARKKIVVKDFENVKLVGRGAFGEVQIQSRSQKKCTKLII